MCPADKPQVNAARFLPLVGLAISKQDQSSMSTVLSTYNGPRQPGPNLIYFIIILILILIILHAFPAREG